MKRWLLHIFLSALTLLCSCNSHPELCGPWIDVGTYNAWKNGAEDVTESSLTIGKYRYSNLSISIIINSYNGNNYFAVPGGYWHLIHIFKFHNNRYALLLSSTSSIAAFGTIIIIYNSNNTIYIVKGSMSDTIKKEFDASMLDFGANFIYKKCDSVLISDK